MKAVHLALLQADSYTLREVRSCKLALSSLTARVTGISQVQAHPPPESLRSSML